MKLIFASKIEVIDGKVVFYGPKEPDKEKAARLREQSDGTQEINISIS